MVLRSIDLIAQNPCLYSIYSRYKLEHYVLNKHVQEYCDTRVEFQIHTYHISYPVEKNK